MSILGSVGDCHSFDAGLAALRRSPSSPCASVQPMPMRILVCDESSLLQWEHLTIALDARIDNRKDLLHALELPLDLSDTEVILRAFLRWGEDCWSRVHGDYAAVVWDAREQRLSMARDSCGTRPMHFQERNGSLIFASEPRGVLAASGVSAKVSEQYVAEWLSATFGRSRNTPYEGVYRLPQGQHLTFRNGRVQVNRWWLGDRIRVERRADPREYAEGVLHHMQAAVEARVSAPVGIGSHLSSGYDSSSVVALSAETLARQGRSLTAFTAVPVIALNDADVPSRNCDEGPIAAETAAMYPNVTHIRVPNNSLPILPTLDIYSSAAATPQVNAGNCVWVFRILQQAQQMGLGVMLNGIEGNLTFSYSGAYALTEFAGHGRLLKYLNLARAYRRHGIGVKPLFNMTVTPYLPVSLLSMIQRRRGKESTTAEFSGLRIPFAEQHGISRNELSIFSVRGKNGRRNRLMILDGLDMGMNFAGDRRLFGVQSADPTGDRRLVEFCLSVPEEAFCAEGVPRSLARLSMNGRLPDSVLNPRRRGLQYADLFVQLTQEREDSALELKRMNESELLRRAIDLPSLQALVDRWPVGETYPENWSDYCIRLTRAVSLGRYVRRLQSGELF